MNLTVKHDFTLGCRYTFTVIEQNICKMIFIQLGEKYSDSGSEFSFPKLLQTKAIHTVCVTTVNVWIKKPYVCTWHSFLLLYLFTMFNLVKAISSLHRGLK